MEEKRLTELEQKFFGKTVAELTVADFKKLMKVYQEQKDNTFLRDLLEKKVENLFLELDYYSLLKLRKYFSSDDESIFNIFEESKLKLMPNFLEGINDPLELIELIEKSYLNMKGYKLVSKRFNEIILDSIDKIKDLDSLISGYRLANKYSKEEEALKEKIQLILCDLSYEKILEIQKKKSISSEDLKDLFEEIKLIKLREILVNNNDLKVVYSMILKEKLFTKSQYFLQEKLADLVEEQIAQINNLNDIVTYWCFSPINSNARHLLETKFYQLLSNYSYEEIQEIKRKNVSSYDALKKLVEKRKREILPDYLESIKSAEKVKDLICREDFSSTVLDQLSEKYTQLKSHELASIKGIDELIKTYSFLSRGSKERKLLEERIKEEADNIKNFAHLFSLYLQFHFKEELQKIIENRLKALLEETKNDDKLKEELKKLTIKEVPKELVALVSQYL